jgi:hypothetical protein
MPTPASEKTEVASPALDKSSKTPSRSHVTIACKWGPGIFMTIYRQEEDFEMVIGGGQRRVTRAVAITDPVKINGPHVKWGKTPAFVIEGGYALTSNVPADVAEHWMEANKDSPMVRNNLIKICEDQEYLVEECREFQETKSGIERLDTRTIHKNGKEVPRDHRWPTKTNPNLSELATDKRDADAA